MPGLGGGPAHAAGGGAHLPVEPDRVLDRDYVRAARARGLNGTLVFGRHVARNAAIPIVTVLAFEVGSIMSARSSPR